MADSSFDVVSKVDRQEVDNALNQAAKELGQRFDFKNTGASIAWSGESGVEIKANSDERVKAALDVFKERMVKRGVSLKALDHGDPQPPTILTIGAFDGVHRGHQHLIKSAVRRARELGCQSAVLTFDPHPDLVIHPERDRLYLTSLEERAELIEQLGADLLIIMPFTRETMGLSALDFMSRLCAAVVLRELWVGWDFALGRKREGDIARLRQIGQQFGYTVHPVSAFALASGTPISSTRIRDALAAADLETAAMLLGRPFAVQGLVTLGDQRGRTIGFPTANIAVDQLQVLPADGVYICRAEVGGQRYGAVTNIGVRPTFDGTRRKVEAYLLDFVDDIYGETLRLTLRQRLRGEKKFDGIAALVAQITADVAAARAWLRDQQA